MKAFDNINGKSGMGSKAGVPFAPVYYKHKRNPFGLLIKEKKCL